MKHFILLAGVLGCYQVSPMLGASSTTASHITDLTKLQLLSDNPASYRLQSIISCTKNGQLTGQRLGLQNTHESVWLNTFGLPSATGGDCQTLEIPLNRYIESLKLFYNEGQIVGTFFQLDDLKYTLVGSMQGDELHFEFSQQSFFIGYDGYIDNGQIIGLSIITQQQSCDQQLIVNPMKQPEFPVIIVTIAATILAIFIIQQLIAMIITFVIFRLNTKSFVPRRRLVGETTEVEILRYDYDLERQSFQDQIRVVLDDLDDKNVVARSIIQDLVQNSLIEYDQQQHRQHQLKNEYYQTCLQIIESTVLAAIESSERNFESYQLALQQQLLLQQDQARLETLRLQQIESERIQEELRIQDELNRLTDQHNKLISMRSSLIEVTEQDIANEVNLESFEKEIGSLAQLEYVHQKIYIEKQNPNNVPGVWFYNQAQSRYTVLPSVKYPTQLTFQVDSILEQVPPQTSQPQCRSSMRNRFYDKPNSPATSELGSARELPKLNRLRKSFHLAMRSSELIKITGASVVKSPLDPSNNLADSQSFYNSFL